MGRPLLLVLPPPDLFRHYVFFFPFASMSRFQSSPFRSLMRLCCSLIWDWLADAGSMAENITDMLFVSRFHENFICVLASLSVNSRLVNVCKNSQVAVHSAWTWESEFICLTKRTLNLKFNPETTRKQSDHLHLELFHHTLIAFWTWYVSPVPPQFTPRLVWPSFT
jgi:hypothetical protein